MAKLTLFACLRHRAFTLMQVTDKVASNQAWAFTATNCTYAPLVKDAKWAFYMAYNGSAVFPADATEFAGAVVNKRYAVWAGGERTSGAVINSTSRGSNQKAW